MYIKPLYPKPLQKGDTIAIIAPAGQLRDRSVLEHGVALLHEMGFLVKFPRSLWIGDSYLADADACRADEFNRIWADPDVHAIIALRGGFGTLRMVDGIDFGSVQKNPKMLVGFSDITTLLNLIYQRTGLVSLHAPVITTIPTSTHAALERLYCCLTTPSYDYPAIQTKKSIEILCNSSQPLSAPLIGGNLTTLTTLLGTKWDLDYSGFTLLLEDIDEPLYKIDRMLTQLLLAGKFAEVSGILLGDFHTATENPQDSPSKHLRYIEAIWNRILQCLQQEGNNCPVYGGFPVGHIRENMAVGIGCRCKIG